MSIKVKREGKPDDGLKEIQQLNEQVGLRRPVSSTITAVKDKYKLKYAAVQYPEMLKYVNEERSKLGKPSFQQAVDAHYKDFSHKWLDEFKRAPSKAVWSHYKKWLLEGDFSKLTEKNKHRVLVPREHVETSFQ